MTNKLNSAPREDKESSMFKNEGLVKNMRKDKAPAILSFEKNDYSILKDREKTKDKDREREIKSTMTFK